jgi:hypothetical protein
VGFFCSETAIPAVGCTQRSSIDCKRGEIHVMTGLNKDKVGIIQDFSPEIQHSIGYGTSVFEI